MSLRFCFGASGSGKSFQIYSDIIKRSMEEPKRNFLIVVPEQFTMQTQKELVAMHERGGIMNIDVLSFGRLSHRIFEEVGGDNLQVLDDTGKSLVLQRVALAQKEQLHVLGGHIHKQGYIHEVKSALSEFMQYGLSVEDVEKLSEFAMGRDALQGKLMDLKTLYKSFQEYIDGHFITTEEKLEKLRKALGKSYIVKDSVIVFDGFTGFTPIQNRLIQELLVWAKEVIVTLTMGADEDPFKLDGEQKLFYLSKKTIYDLEKLAQQVSVARGEDIFIRPKESPRFGKSGALDSLEKNLFRNVRKNVADADGSIRILEAHTPKAEVHQVGVEIARLIREENLQYRDIAVISGDLESYASFVEREFRDMHLPCYIDRTRGIVLNPMIELIKSALELFIKDFSYEAVFHYLRSGLTGFEEDSVDCLENYILQTGIRGVRRWERLFTHKTEEMEEKEEPLQEMNELREKFISQVAVLGGKRRSAKEHVEALYAFLVQLKVQEKLEDMSRKFEAAGDLTRGREYAQIYRLVIELLDQIYSLLAEEEIADKEFLEILEAGFAEIEVGTIPQNVDRILVGDMERTRLKQIKVLFFVGVNDGNIPKNASKGGILSDMDREFLRGSYMELAPSPRQQMFIQRFYLYLNMTKPSQRLILSYAKVNSAGKSLRPSYLINMVSKMFSGLSPEQIAGQAITQQMVTAESSIPYLADGLREYAEGNLTDLTMEELFALYSAYSGQEAYAALAEDLKKAAFYRYEDSLLSKAVARALYGKRLETSISRLEMYAACAYHHFLQYGLSLKERKELGFESVDMGNIYHEVLDTFSRKLEESEYTWFNFPMEFADSVVEETMEHVAAEYGAGVLYSSARKAYAATRMSRVLKRTVATLQKQLKQGEFVPNAHEISFNRIQDAEAVDVRISEEEALRLHGRIDRVDIAQDDENVYVKIIDYKSGDKHFDLAAVYYGLQLQLVVYMNAALEMEAKKNPDKNIIPAALLYYHVEDPMVEGKQGMSPEEINELIRKELRMNGVVNSSEDVIARLDRELNGKSEVIPVERKKDGTLSARSDVYGQDELKVISSYVNQKVRCIGKEILMGHKEVNPYEEGNKNACEYCAYKKVCGFDPSIPGYSVRKPEVSDNEEIMRRMREELQ